MHYFIFHILPKENYFRISKFVPSAAIGNDGAREGIIVCLERLMSMGIPISNIFIYDLALLLSDGYKRTYSSKSKVLSRRNYADMD